MSHLDEIAEKAVAEIKAEMLASGLDPDFVTTACSFAAENETLAFFLALWQGAFPEEKDEVVKGIRELLIDHGKLPQPPWTAAEKYHRLVALAEMVADGGSIVIRDGDVQTLRDAIPKQVLFDHIENRFKGLRERPLMYGGDWHGVETMILDLLELREILLAYPKPSPGHFIRTWSGAICKVHRSTNGTLHDTLVHDGITEHDALRDKFSAAIDECLKS